MISLRPRGRFLPIGLLCFALLSPGRPTSAQWHRATDPVMTPATSIVNQDDALLVDINPGALALTRAYSLAYLHSEVDQRDSWLGRGDAVYMSTPLFFGLAAGLTLQSIRPGPLAARPTTGGREADRAMGGLSLAYSPHPSFGLGLTTRGLSSGNPRLDGLASIDMGLTWRPSPRLGISLLGKDLFLSREGQGTDGLAVGSAFQVGASVRPTGTSDLTLDLGLLINDQADLSGRAGLSVRVRSLGFVAGMVELEQLGDSDPALRVLVELTLQMGPMSLVGGGTGGDGFNDKVGWYGMLRVDGASRPGMVGGGAVLDMELSGLGARGMLAVALALERARQDQRISGVLLRPRGSGMGPAYAQELRLQIKALRDAGKPVVCHITSASGPEYYACAAADRVLIDPAGSVQLLGTSMRILLFGETLDKVGIRADFIRIGRYKGAPEQYTQGKMGEAARAQTRQLLDDVHRRVLFDLGGDLNISQEQVAAIMDDGPHLATRAVEGNLVAGTADETDLSDIQLSGWRGKTRELPKPYQRNWGVGPRIGVVVIDGTIVDGSNVDIPLLDIHMSGGTTVVEAIDGMAADASIRAIVIRVDSPGGAVVASDQIWRAIQRARKRKPVIASMGQVAASGGYYAAAAAQEIWADPSTLTGSIGIFYGKVDVAPLAQKIGIGVEVFQRGRRAGADSLWRPFTDDERAALAETLREYYRLFLSRVSEGRGMPMEVIDRVARGRVLTGDAALEAGLIDRLGGFASALARARQLAGLAGHADVVVRPKRKSGLLDYVLGGVSLEMSAQGPALESDPVHLPQDLSRAVQVVMQLQQMGAAQPMALLPYDIRF